MPTLKVRRAWKRNGSGEFEVKGAGRQYLGKPKTRESRRQITLAPAVVAGLRRAIQGKTSDDLVFGAPRGGRLDQRNWYVDRWLRAVRAARAAGREKRPRLHDVRHTHAAWLISACVLLQPTTSNPTSRSSGRWEVNGRHGRRRRLGWRRCRRAAGRGRDRLGQSGTSHPSPNSRLSAATPRTPSAATTSQPCRRSKIRSTRFHVIEALQACGPASTREQRHRRRHRRAPRARAAAVPTWLPQPPSPAGLSPPGRRAGQRRTPA